MPPSSLPPNVESHLEGLASLGVVFVQLIPGEKRTTRGWDHFQRLHDVCGLSRIDLATQWLRKGYGVGYLPGGKHWVVDCDSPETVARTRRFCLDAGLVPPMCITPSLGAHFSFGFPGGLEKRGMKHHVCHPKENEEKVPWDFKLGTRTMLVAPGTQTPKGIYLPPGPWVEPPVLDPRSLSPGLEIYRERRDFLVDERDFNCRG